MSIIFGDWCGFSGLELETARQRTRDNNGSFILFLSMYRGADTVKDCGHHASSDESAETVCSVYFRLFEMFIPVGGAWAHGQISQNEVCKVFCL